MTYETERTESESPEPVESPERVESPARPELIPQDERDTLALRLQQSLGGFADAPRHAVEEAAAVFEEAADGIAAALTERRHFPSCRLAR